MKKALILGVGDAQADMIRYLKDTGWHVIGISYRHEGSGLSFIDRFEPIDITDRAKLEALARKEQVKLVYSIGSDLAMPSISWVSEKLGLPSAVSCETVELMRNKLLFRSLLSSHGISPVRFAKVSSEADMEKWSIYPAVIKPADSQGQRGIFIAHSKKDIHSGLANTLSHSKSKTAIVEEWFDGPEISVNVFVLDSRMAFFCVSDRVAVKSCSSGVPQEHILPARRASKDAIRQAEKMIGEIIRILGIQNGPLYFQMKLTADGPKILEAAPRLDGCHLWRLIRFATGVDLLKAGVDQLNDNGKSRIQADGKIRPYRLRFFLSDPGKVFKKSDHRSPDGADHVEYYYEDGETVRTVNGVLEKAGFYIVRDSMN